MIMKMRIEKNVPHISFCSFSFGSLTLNVAVLSSALCTRSTNSGTSSVNVPIDTQHPSVQVSNPNSQFHPSTIFSHHRKQRKEERKGKRNAPNGPVTVIVFLTTGLYDVALRTALGSPMTTSTPGGTLSGVRPSFDRAACVVENGRCRVAEGEERRNRPADEDAAGRNAERGLGEAAAAAAADKALPLLRQGARIPAIWIAELGILCRNSNGAVGGWFCLVALVLSFGGCA